MKDHTLTRLLTLTLASGLPMQTQALSQVSAPAAQAATVTVSSVCGDNSTYDQLTADGRKALPPQNIELGRAPIELSISTREFSDRPVDAKRVSSPDFCFWNTLLVGVNVSTAGEIFSFANGEGSVRGGGGGKLASENFDRLQSLMDKLPDDNNRVPPATRRIVVEVRRGDTLTVRLYDSADLPDEIVEMLRLTGARIRIATPILEPDGILRTEELSLLGLTMPRRGDGQLTISPDGSTGILHSFVTKTLTVYQGSTWPKDGAGMPVGGEIVRVIPEFWQPPNYGGYWVSSEFSPDGRYLLVTWGERVGALLFDTATWDPVTDARVFPQNLKEYLHSPDWNLGIAVTKDGETLVWDQQSHRVLSKLSGLEELESPPVITDQQGHRAYTETMAEIQSAAFSPDRTRVAVFSGPDDIFKLRLSIFDIQTGKKERDLWPVAWTSYPSGAPLWWNDGRWLLAPFSSQFSGEGTGLWDAKNGRFLGTLDFSGCDARVSPVTAGTRLVQACFVSSGLDGRTLEWSVDGVRKQIEASASPVSRGQDSTQ